MIPGSNLLNQALLVIAKQTVTYYKFAGRTVNAIGYDVANYNAPVTVQGSVQPVQRQVYQEMGLDFQKSYVTLWISRDVIDIARDVSGDYFTFAGRKYQCLSEMDWFNMDGWTSVLSVDIGNA